MQFIDLQTQYRKLKEQIDFRVQKVLDHGSYILGPEVFEFEEILADYVGVKHAVTCGNGTDALQLSLMALGIGPGDVVLTTTFTFFATAEVICLIGATPIFVDIDERTFNIDPVKLEEAIVNFQSTNGETIKAVIAVDLFGLPADYPFISAICNKYNLKLVEDFAQGFGGEINGKRAGSFGDIAATSFFPAKPLGCYGDGGAVCTDDEDLANIIRSLRVHGKGIDKYDNVRIGMNSRLDTIQAAILLEKLAIFPQELIARNAVAKRYQEALGNEFVIPTIPEGFTSSWAQYALITSERSKWLHVLESRGVPTGVYYRKCMHQQRVFSGSEEGISLPVSERVSSQIMSLPMHPYLSSIDIDRIVSCFRRPQG